MSSKHLSRRRFINVGIQGSLTSLAIPFLATQCTSAPEDGKVKGACYHDCPDTCSWEIEVEKGRIRSFSASKSNPYTNGHLCAKMDDFPVQITFHPQRLLTPLKRTGIKGEGKFEPISWAQALSEVAVKLQAIITTYGGQAIMPYSYAGTEGLIQHSALSDRFFAHIGATRLARTICGDAAVAGVMAVNGQTTGVLPEDIVHSRYIILWGTNPINSNPHLWPFIQQARAKGSKIVVVDPFKSSAAQEADWHIQLCPGTDTALALALMHVILTENLEDQDYIAQHTTGIEALRQHVQAYSPEAMASVTGLKPEIIRQLAREYATTSPALIRVMIALEKQANGANAFRAVAMLPALTGAWQNRGGGLMHFTYELFGEALNWERLTLAEKITKPGLRTVNMIQLGQALTSGELQPAIQALLVYNCNPAVITPRQNLVLQGLAREDLLTIVLEHFMTDTARFADYIFPATTQLEHWDLMTSYGQPYLNLNQPAIPPLGETKPNSEFFRILAKEMGFNESYFTETDLEIIKKTLRSDHPYLKGITFNTLLKSGWAKLQLPEPWMPFAKGGFKTPSGKCEFYSDTLAAQNQSALPVFQPREYTEDYLRLYPLHLLTIKSSPHFLNTSHANNQTLLAKEGSPRVDMHAEDAQVRGITDGQYVKIYNDYGTVNVQVRISDKVRPGVLCMPQGYWREAFAGGATANALTNDALTDMGEGSALQECRVQVQSS